jgi:hypothetical protein
MFDVDEDEVVASTTALTTMRCFDGHFLTSSTNVSERNFREDGSSRYQQPNDLDATRD